MGEVEILSGGTKLGETFDALIVCLECSESIEQIESDDEEGIWCSIVVLMVMLVEASSCFACSSAGNE